MRNNNEFEFIPGMEHKTVVQEGNCKKICIRWPSEKCSDTITDEYVVQYLQENTEKTIYCILVRDKFRHVLFIQQKCSSSLIHVIQLLRSHNICTNRK